MAFRPRVIPGFGFGERHLHDVARAMKSAGEGRSEVCPPSCRLSPQEFARTNLLILFNYKRRHPHVKWGGLILKAIRNVSLLTHSFPSVYVC